MANDTNSLADALAQVPLFAGLKKRQLRDVAGVARSIRHAPGNEVAAEGTGGLAFHIITEGSAEVSVGGTSRHPLTVGDYFGEVSMIDGKPRTATVTAGPNGLVTAALHRSAFMSLLQKDFSVASAVLVALCARIRLIEAAR